MINTDPLHSFRLWPVFDVQWIPWYVAPSAPDSARPAGYPVNLPVACFRQLLHAHGRGRESQPDELPAAICLPDPEGYSDCQPSDRNDPDQSTLVHVSGHAAQPAPVVRSLTSSKKDF